MVVKARVEARATDWWKGQWNSAFQCVWMVVENDMMRVAGGGEVRETSVLERCGGEDSSYGLKLALPNAGTEDPRQTSTGTCRRGSPMRISRSKKASSDESELLQSRGGAVSKKASPDRKYFCPKFCTSSERAPDSEKKKT